MAVFHSRHNELRDITAELMSKIYHNVSTEPPLQPITDERLVHRTANREDGARLDVAADSFGGNVIQTTYIYRHKSIQLTCVKLLEHPSGSVLLEQQAGKETSL